MPATSKESFSLFLEILHTLFVSTPLSRDNMMKFSASQAFEIFNEKQIPILEFMDKNEFLFLQSFNKVFNSKFTNLRIFIPFILTTIFIESNFKDSAISKAGAMGLFQILPSTLRLYLEKYAMLKEFDSNSQLLLIGVYKVMKSVAEALPFINTLMNDPLGSAAPISVVMLGSRLIYHYGTASAKKFMSIGLSEFNDEVRAYQSYNRFNYLHLLFRSALVKVQGNGVLPNSLVFRPSTKKTGMMESLSLKLKNFIRSYGRSSFLRFKDCKESDGWVALSSRVILANKAFDEELRKISPMTREVVLALGESFANAFVPNIVYRLSSRSGEIYEFHGSQVFILITSVVTDWLGNTRDALSSPHHNLSIDPNGAVDAVFLIDMGVGKYLWLDNIAEILLLVLSVTNLSYILSKMKARIHLEPGHAHIDQDCATAEVIL